MTNKRITELTALDGDDVADNDVLAIVDVSDTTMAASGTTKKITVAELVTDSALTNKFWPNSTTALTGANLANGDKLAVVDVGSPDVAKYITADELAQGSQFSSRYVGKSGDRLWISARDMNPGANVTATTVGYWATPCLSYADTSYPGAGATVVLPAHWTTFDVKLYWTVASGSGNVQWQVFRQFAADGTDIAAASTVGTAQTVTAPAASIVKITSHQTGITATNPFLTVFAQRNSDVAADTLTAAAILIGILLERAS